MHIFIDGEDMGPAATALAKVHTHTHTRTPQQGHSYHSAPLSGSLQNVYAVLDLYGRVTAVSIVSSSPTEDTESVKAPPFSSDSCREGEEDSTPVTEVGAPACPSRGPVMRRIIEFPEKLEPLRVASHGLQVETEPCPSVPTGMVFLENHGKNIQLSNRHLTAARVSSYNQGLLVTAQPLARLQLFQVTVCGVQVTRS